MPEHAARADVQLPARVTMPLLTLITQQSLDEDYLHVAERRAAGAPVPRGPVPTGWPLWSSRSSASW